MNVIQTILSLKSYILLPLLMLILGVCMRARVLEAVKGALYISVAQIGISILATFFIETAVPVISSISAAIGKASTVTDVGWPVIAVLVWTLDVIYLIVPIHIAVNLLMLWLKQTQTINVDIWNYWHIAVASFLVYAATGSIWLVVAADVMMSVICIKLCDWARPAVENFYTMEKSQCISTANSLVYLPVAVAMDAVIERIPGLRRLSIVPQKLEGRWKVLMSPGFVALVVGLALSLSVGYSIVNALDFSVKFAAVFMLLPRVLYFLKAGFSPVADATASFAKRRIKDGRQVYVGVNHLVVADNPSVIISTIVLIPIALLMGALIPWVRIFPMGDLMNIVSIIIVIVAVCRGNIVRSVLISIPVILLNLVLASVVAPVYAQIAQRLSYDMGNVTGVFAASLNGGTYISLWVSDLLQGRLWALITIPVVVAAGYLCYRYYKVSLRRLSYGAGQKNADAIEEETI